MPEFCALTRWMLLVGCIAVVGCAKTAPEQTSAPIPPVVIPPVAEPGRHFEREEGFSYVLPTDWTVREIPGLFKSKIAFGPPGETYVPNCNFQHEDYAGTLDEYVDLNIQGLKDAQIDFQILQDPAAVAVDGELECRRLMIECIDGEQTLRQTFFFIRHQQRMYVITASVLKDGGEEFDAIFQSLAKSLRVENV